MANIEETNKSNFVPDTSLNPVPNMDLSGIKASVDAITKSVADIVAGYQKAGETKMEQPKQPAQTGILGRISPQVQQPTKTSADYIAEQQSLRSSFLDSIGINQEDYDQRTNLASQMASLNQQLQMKEIQALREEELIKQNMPGALGSSVRGEIAKMNREVYFQKATIAAQIAGLSAQHSIIQGNIDEANKFFDQAINYATAKERQDVEDYRWALGFYADIDKADRDFLQQEFDNKLKINADARAQESHKWDIIRTKASLSGGDDFLSISDAKSLGVPYGTTKRQAMEMGLVPSSGESEMLSKSQLLKMSEKGLPSDVAQDIAGYVSAGSSWEDIYSGLSGAVGGEKANKYIQTYRNTIRTTGEMYLGMPPITEPVPDYYKAEQEKNKAETPKKDFKWYNPLTWL